MSEVDKDDAVFRGMEHMVHFLTHESRLFDLGEQCVGIFFDIWALTASEPIRAFAETTALDLLSRLEVASQQLTLLV